MTTYPLDKPSYFLFQDSAVMPVKEYYKLALYLPYVQGLFTMTNNENFTTCTCSSIQ